MESGGGEDCEKEGGLESHFTIILGNFKFLKIHTPKITSSDFLDFQK